jgi:nitroreductase
LVFISAGATQYLLLVAALYGIGACIYAGKIQKKRILLIKLMF